MTYQPRIFIRDYGTPTDRYLAYAGYISITGVDPALLRTLFISAENDDTGLNSILLSGDMQSGTDLLNMSGDEAPDLILLSNKASFILTGGNVGFVSASDTLVVSGGLYNLSGNAAGTLRHYPYTAVSGSFSLSGFSVGTINSLIMPALSGTNVLTGFAAALGTGYVSLAENGSYTLTGVTVSYLLDSVMPAVTKTYSVTGWNNTLTRTIAEPVLPGSYSVSGVAADFVLNTLSDPSLLLSGDMSDGASDSLSLSGDESPGIVLTSEILDLVALPGSYSLTGYAASFDISEIAPHTSYSLTGYTVLLSRSMVMQSVGYNLTGSDALLTFPFPVTTSVFSLVGSDAILTADLADKILLTGDMQSGGDKIALSGDEDPGLLLITYINYPFTADTGTFTMTVNPAGLVLRTGVGLSGDMQSGVDVVTLSGDEIGNILLTIDTT